MTLTTVSCCVCGEESTEDQILSFGSDKVCVDCKDTYVQGIREGVSTYAPDAGFGLEVKRRTVIAPLEVDLPGRCIKCNEAATLTKSKKLSYSPPWAYLVGGALMSVAMQKKTTVSFGLCDRHARRRKNGLLVGWLGGIGSLLLLVPAVLLMDVSETVAGFLFIAVFPLFLITIITGAIMSSTIRATKMDKERVWIGGTGKAFRESLK